jgi:protein SCO1/2
VRPAPDLAPAFRFAERRGQVVVISFGFTSCPDVCPLTLARMKALYRELGPDGARITAAFVSVDPGRDSPERLETYARSFDKRIVPVRLEGRALSDALAAWGVTAARRPVPASRYASFSRAADDYLVDHTAGFFLVDKLGRLRLRHPHDASARALADDVRMLLAERDAALRVEEPSAAVTPTAAAVYLRIVNATGSDDRLLFAHTRAARGVELHESVEHDGVIRMVSPERGFTVPAGRAIELRPGGKHLMLVGLAALPRDGKLELTLEFQKAGPVPVMVPLAAGM